MNKTAWRAVGALAWAVAACTPVQAITTNCDALKTDLAKAVEFLDPLAEENGIFSPGSTSLLKQKIGKARDTAAAAGDLAAICAAIQQRNEIEAYFIVLDKISTLAGPAAGYMQQQVRAGRWIIANARSIAAGANTRTASLSYGLLEFRVHIERQRSYLPNTTYARSEANRQLLSASLSDGIQTVDVSTDENRLNSYEDMTQARAVELYHQDPYRQRYLRLHAADLRSDLPVFLRLKFVDGNDVVVPVSRDVPGVGRQLDNVTLTILRHADNQYGLK